VRFSVEDKTGLRQWIIKAIVENKKIPGDINFIVTNDKELHKINLRYLNTDTYTDIITFSLSEEEKIVSGDIYLSIERIMENAARFKVSTAEEFRRILIHGILHLLGREDSSVEGKKQMRRLENKFLKAYTER
jgi:rRNA maturation RNase YbeY